MELEIKFRIFDPAQKVFINPSKFSFNADFSQKLFRGDLKLAKESHSEKCEISQFTGFIDKKGNDIYNGDILRFDFHSKSYEVIWHDGAYYLKNGNQNARLSRTSLSGYYVVGNVFENPEMLLVTQADA